MAPDPRLNTHTGRICNHMNVDHVHTVLAMARMQWPEATQASCRAISPTRVPNLRDLPRTVRLVPTECT